MPDATILVILYNKKFSDSDTINALINSDSIRNSRIVIWNNGPSSLKEDEGIRIFDKRCHSFVFKETLGNISLATVYNWVIGNFDSERYIILDHDSNLTENYLINALNVSPENIGMPLIYSDNIIVNPCNHGRPITSKRSVKKEDYITTIGSGLVIGKKIIRIMLEKNKSVFDERFGLYGVDTTFCYRLHELRLFENIVLIDGFEHSLSRLEIEDLKTLKFRQIERSKDLALRIRHYCSLKEKIITIIMLLASYFKKILLQKKQQYILGVFIKTYLKGYYDK